MGEHGREECFRGLHRFNRKCPQILTCPPRYNTVTGVRACGTRDECQWNYMVVGSSPAGSTTQQDFRKVFSRFSAKILLSKSKQPFVGSPMKGCLGPVAQLVEHLISQTLVVTTNLNTNGGALLARAREPGKEVIATGGLTSGCGSKLVEGSLQLHRNSQRGPSREAHFKPRLGHG
jgi:hypothetical protein